MKIDTKTEVGVEDCLDALSDYFEYQTYGYCFPPTEHVKQLQKLYDQVMEKWIAPKNRCEDCSGFGEHSCGAHSSTCYDCDGTGRRKNE